MLDQTKEFSFTDVLQNTEKQKALIKEEQHKPITMTARNLTFAGLTVGGGLMFIMFATQIITGIAALVLTATVGIGGFLGIRFLKTMDPLIRQKTQNAKTKWMMEEARRNSIEQLQNLVLKRRGKLTDGRAARDKMKGFVQKISDGVDGADESSSMYKKQIKMLKTAEGACIKMSTNIDSIAKSNKLFEVKVEEFRKMDKMNEIFAEAMALFGSTVDDHIDEMLSLEAFDSIETDFNQAVISMDAIAHDMQIDQGDA